MEERIGMIAGSGQFPLLFAKAAHSKGMQVYAVGYHGETDPVLSEHVSTLEWLYVGQVKRIINFFRQHDITRAVMLGGIGKVKLLTNFRPDTKAIGLLARIRNTHDDAVLRGFADLLLEEGIQIEASTMLLPELLSPPGVWTSRKPSRDEREDIRLGWKIAKEIGRLDVGQCVVTAGGSVVAVEAIEGTDAAITRGGKLADGQAVVVKVCKPTQDTRFDIPAIGLRTIETMHKANVKTLAVEAGKSVVFDRSAMIAKADQYKISIVGLEDGEFSRTPSSNEHSSGSPEPDAEKHIPKQGWRKIMVKEESSSGSSLPLRVGVVGVGYLGKFHAEKYAKHPDVELVGVVDSQSEQADKIAESLGCKSFYNHEELFGKVDAVSIAVPTEMHFAISRDFIKQNIDVLIEKPITSTVEEADGLLKLAEEYGVLIQVGQLERFNPAVVALEDRIKKPLFIESHRLSQFKPRSLDVSVVLDLMIHDIDIILNLVKSKIKNIHAAGIPVITDNIDIANARLEFESGCIANVTASRISMKNERKIRLFQKDAYISINFAEHGIVIVEKDEEQNQSIIPGMTIDKRDFANADALDQEIRSFVEAVTQKKEPKVTGRMGRDALEIAHSVMDQIQQTSERLINMQDN